MADQPKTKRTVVSTTSVAPTGALRQPVTLTTTRPTTSTTTTTDTAPPEPRPARLPRRDVRVNVGTIEQAFLTGAHTRSVMHVQRALVEQGFKPGNTDGRVDYETRAAYASFQKSVNERATGVPTDDSLDLLGFDIVG